jgi:hypothetical protein
MSAPQYGIFAQGTVAHSFLEFDLRRGAGLDALRELRQPAVSAGGVNLVVAFGSSLWRRLAPDHAPTSLRPFTPVVAPGGYYFAPSLTLHRGAGVAIAVGIITAYARAYLWLLLLMLARPMVAFVLVLEDHPPNGTSPVQPMVERRPAPLPTPEPD